MGVKKRYNFQRKVRRANVISFWAYIPVKYSPLILFSFGYEQKRLLYNELHNNNRIPIVLNDRLVENYEKVIFYAFFYGFALDTI